MPRNCSEQTEEEADSVRNAAHQTQPKACGCRHLWFSTWPHLITRAALDRLLIFPEADIIICKIEIKMVPVSRLLWRQGWVYSCQALHTEPARIKHSSVSYDDDDRDVLGDNGEKRKGASVIQGRDGGCKQRELLRGRDIEIEVPRMSWAW